MTFLECIPVRTQARMSAGWLMSFTKSRATR